MHALNLPVITLLVAAAIWADTAFAGGRGAIARELVETVVGRSGREVAEKAARKSTEQAVEVVAKRKALLEAYEKEGQSLFERIPPKLVLAGGLTTAAIYGTHRGTAPMAALGNQIDRDPSLARRTLDWVAVIGGSAVLLVTAGVMWWAGLFGRRPAPLHARM